MEKENMNTIDMKIWNTKRKEKKVLKKKNIWFQQRSGVLLENNFLNAEEEFVVIWRKEREEVTMRGP